MTGEPPVLENESPGKKSGDQALLLALATGTGVPKAADSAGVSVSTVYRRLHDPAFRRKVSELRDQLWSDAVGQLLDAGPDAVKTLRDNLDNVDGAIRNRAALGILTLGCKGVETLELARRIADLEQGR